MICSLEFSADSGAVFVAWAGDVVELNQNPYPDPSSKWADVHQHIQCDRK
jgi:hypothetical protein